MAATVSSDDSILVETIVAENNPDGIEYDVKPIFLIVEDALRRSTLSSDIATMLAFGGVKEKSHHLGHNNMLDALSANIERISSEISYKTLNGVDGHSTTVSIFNTLTMYKWDVKIVLALAAFTLTYGDFWLLAHIHGKYRLAKTLAILKQVPSIMDHANSLKPRFDTLNDLVNIILEVTKCVIEFHYLPTQYITQAYTTAYNYIPVACYWTLRSIVACTAQITSFTTFDYEIFTTTDTWELSAFTLNLKNINDNLRQLLDSCREYINKQTEMISTGSASKLDGEDYAKLRGLLELFLTTQTDNMNVLKALIYSRDDILPLYDGVTKKRVNLQPLRRTTVLLLFSSMEITTNELRILGNVYNDSKGGEIRCELVWIPIVDPSSEWTEPKQKHFKSLQESMPWYSVYHPSLIVKPVLWFIQREWKYKNKPIVVVLDPQGRVSCPNAIHMMWIWGSDAYPFTSSREEALWKEATWTFELLVKDIDHDLFFLVQKHIFIYGGDDPEWVRRFVKEALRVATAARIYLKTLYVGKSNKWKQVQKIIDTLQREELKTKYVEDQSKIWLFWTRLQSMLFSKLQLKQTNENNHMMKEIQKLLSYDKHGGWFLLARNHYYEDHIVVIGHATAGLQTLEEYAMWEENVKRDGFGEAFKNHYDKINSVVSPCCRIEFSHTIYRIPGSLLSCPECHGNMHVLTTFQCCHDEKIDEDFLASTLTLPSI